MDALMYNIRVCLGIGQGLDYVALYKKDDDLSQHAVDQWIRLYPADDSLKSLSSKVIAKYVSLLFQDLKKININNSNYRIIADHLYKIAKKNAEIRRICLEKLRRFDCPKQEKDFLQERLIFLVSDCP